jgi:hypothetical protein
LNDAKDLIFCIITIGCDIPEENFDRFPPQNYNLKEQRGLPSGEIIAKLTLFTAVIFAVIYQERRVDYKLLYGLMSIFFQI